MSGAIRGAEGAVPKGSLLAAFSRLDPSQATVNDIRRAADLRARFAELTENKTGEYPLCSRARLAQFNAVLEALQEDTGRTAAEQRALYWGDFPDSAFERKARPATASKSSSLPAPTDRFTLLWEAVSGGNVEELRGLIESLPKEDLLALLKQTREDTTLLMQAARMDQEEAIQALLHPLSREEQWAVLGIRDVELKGTAFMNLGTRSFVALKDLLDPLSRKLLAIKRVAAFNGITSITCSTGETLEAIVVKGEPLPLQGWRSSFVALYMIKALQGLRKADAAGASLSAPSLEALYRCVFLPPDKRLQALQEGKLSFILTGHKSHAMVLVVHGPCLFICNRGDRPSGKPTLLTYRIDRARFTPLILDELNKLGSEEGSASLKFLYEQLPALLSSDGKVYPISYFPSELHPKNQTVGNCSKASLMTALFVGLVVTACPSEERDLPLARQAGFVEAKRVYKLISDDCRLMAQEELVESYRGRLPEGGVAELFLASSHKVAARIAKHTV